MNQIYPFKPWDVTAEADLLAIDPTELLTRRRFIIGTGGILGATVLGACSAGEQAATPTATTTGTRTVTHTQGQTEMPARAERIVSISLSATGSLLAVGAPLVGSQGGKDLTGDPSGFFPAYADVAQERGVQLLYEGFEPNLEAIAAVQPDAIIGTADDASGGPSIEIYDELSAVAPTVLFNFANKSWQDILVEVAAAVGYAAAAREWLAEYEEMEREVAAAITLPPQPTSLITKSSADPNFYLLPPDTAAGALLAGAGFEIVSPPGYEGNMQFVPISNELVTEAITGRTLFFFEVPGSETLADLQQQPLWAQVPAISEGHAYPLSFEVVRPDPYVALALLRDLQSRFG